VGAGYLERNWPPALKESGAWPLTSLRQSFLNGSLTRLVDPDSVLQTKIVEFVDRGDFGLASGQKRDGTYERVWFNEPIGSDEITFEAGVFLVLKAKATALATPPEPELEPEPKPPFELKPKEEIPSVPGSVPVPKSEPAKRTLRVAGEVPPELWNRLGTKLLPKLRLGEGLTVDIRLSVKVESRMSESIHSDLRQILEDLGISDKVEIAEE
ncbi:MAG: AAA family ATPase, partial [Planctomycetota bacterium]|nr:AAA family ATPase [Planctomycetota bacterium]